MGRARAAPFAATLSFLFPGLGQAALGRRRRALVFALPALVTAGALAALAWSIAREPDDALDLLLRPEAIAVVLIVDVGLLLWHLAAIVDAERLARVVRPVSGGRRIVASGVLVAVLVASVALHGTVGVVDAEAGDTLGAIFVGDGPDASFAIPEPSFAVAGESPGPGVGSTGGIATTGPGATAIASLLPSPWSSTSLAPTESAGPSAAGPSSVPGSPGASALTGPSVGSSPGSSLGASIVPSPSARASTPPAAISATPTWARDGRLDLLLIGSDAGPDRWSLRTDTMIVLSVDVKTGRAALFGIPRNMIGVPLPPESARAFHGGRFPGLLNALYVYAMRHPASFPGGDARGMRAVSGAVQELLGVRLDGMAVVNLAGFVQLVDELGGLWIDVPSPLVDHMYPIEDGSGLIELRFAAGCQHLEGRMALAYARSRHQDSDYGRMRRQQAVLLALRRQLDPVALVPKVPDLLRIARDDLWTTIARSDVRGPRPAGRPGRPAPGGARPLRPEPLPRPPGHRRDPGHPGPGPDHLPGAASGPRPGPRGGPLPVALNAPGRRARPARRAPGRLLRPSARRRGHARASGERRRDEGRPVGPADATRDRRVPDVA